MFRPVVLVLALLLVGGFITPSAAKLAGVTDGVPPSVAVYVVGVDDPVARTRMQTDVAALLGRNRVVVDPEHGIPLTLTLERAVGNPGTATWHVSLDACDGRRLGRARFASAVPADARDPAYAAALVAAVTSRLPQMRGWLAVDAEARP